MWFLPTRNRPDAMKAFIASMQATGCVPELAVMIDGNPVLYADVPWPANWHIHVAPEHFELTRAFNSLYALYSNEKFYGTMVDHIEFVSKGDWAGRVEAAAGDWNMAFAEDRPGYNARTGFPRIKAVTGFGGKLIKELGYVYPDFCVHLAGDDALEEMGWELGIVKIPRDTLIKTLFFIRGEFRMDDNHKRVYQGKPYAQADMDAFFEWQKTTKPGLMARLDALIPGECRIAPLVAKKIEAVTVCCVNAGNYQGRGAEYVNNLYDMVARNLADTFVGKFVCFTDDPQGLHPGIEVRALPEPELEGWWNKLALFKPGVFKDGERVWFLDLDTLIISNLDAIMRYPGEFATLKDFYYPSRVGPAVMSWRVGELSKSIWTEWEGNGKPQDGHGDLWWINNLDQGRFAKQCDKLQDLFPDSFVSFKVHCQPYPPKGASVVCFHGEPRPHAAEPQWVKDVWKVGGFSVVSVNTFCNVADSELHSNIRAAMKHDVQWLEESPIRKGEAVIVGGGPSLRFCLEEIQIRQRSGHKIFALNNAAKALADFGIIPDYQIVMDARAENAAFVKDSPARTVMLASQCHPDTWEAATDEHVVLFHVSIPGIREMIGERETILIGGGTTVLTRAMAVVHFMGYRYQHLYGVDSSFAGEAHHAYEQALNADAPSDVIVNGKSFKSCPWMIAQVDEFQSVAKALNEEDAKIIVHGDGLLPYVAQLMAA